MLGVLGFGSGRPGISGYPRRPTYHVVYLVSMNDTNVQVYRFEPADAQVRLVLRDGEPWFVASDLAAVLGLGRQQDATRYLDDDERQLIDTDTVPTNPAGAVSSKNPQTLVVSEAGMYSMILRSRKAQAKVFKRWVTHEVLPAIRRAGRYEVDGGGKLVPVPRAADVLRALADEVEAREMAEKELVGARVAVEGLTPFYEAWNNLVVPGTTWDVNTAAKILSSDPDIEIGSQRLYKRLEEMGWIFRDKHKKWRAYQTAVKAGWLVCKAVSQFRGMDGVLYETFQVRLTKRGLVKMYYSLGGSTPGLPVK